jgi:tetratricopeptide (TPR) repeat protein
MWSTWLAYFTGDSQAAYAHAQGSLEIAERIGDAFSRAVAPTFLGMAHVISGEYAEAIPHLERSDEIIRERRTALEFQPWTLSFLAEALAGVGELDHARAAGEDALELATVRAQAALEANARCALARVLLAGGDPGAGDEIARLLAEAIAIADRIGARSENLQARMDLVRLADLRGDERGRQRALEDTRSLAEEIGATGHARRLAAELAAVS